jgi:2-hydroxy-3-oxopropionate reductase
MTDSLSPRVAVIGVGVMGGAIATRLLETGATVAVFDRDRSKTRALAEKGARAADSAADAARGASFVITSVNSAKIVEAAVFGPDGVARAADAETLLIDMSSIDPDSTRALAARFREVTGGHWLDCPLSGGAPGALTGRLTVIAGGEDSDFERARAVMSRLTANYTLMGPTGAGQATKLVNQVLCAIQFQAVAEAVALAQRAGVAAERIPSALAGGRADSRILQEFGAKMARRDYSPTGRLDNMLKDLDGVQALARATLTPLPATAIVAEIHRALVGAGLGAADSAALMRQFDPPGENRSRVKGD